MRIALVNHTPIYGSGSGSYIKMLAVALLRDKHQVCIVTPLADQFTFASQLSYLSVPLSTPQFPSFTGHPLSSLRYADLDTAASQVIEYDWIHSFEELQNNWIPDTVHIQHLSIVTRAAIRAGLKPIVTSHGSEIKFARQYPSTERNYMPDIQSISALIVISNYVKQLVTETISSSLKPIVVHNPCDTSIFQPITLSQRSSPHIGFVGRLVAYKNCNEFINIVKALQSEIPNLTASIIGDGPLKADLIALSQQLGISDKIHFLGFMDQDKLAQQYASFDVTVVPSTDEPFGLVAIESVACGTPALVAQSGGLVDIIDPPFVWGYDPTMPGHVLTVIKQVLQSSIDNQICHNYIRRRYGLSQYTMKMVQIYSEQL